MIYLSLDLEMNQPSGAIVQIGAVVGEVLTGEILGTFSKYVSLPEGEELNPFIIKLCNIDLDTYESEKIDLKDAYIALLDFRSKYEVERNPITWGGGDSDYLYKQTYVACGNELKNWPFGRRWVDIKTVFQMYCIANGIKHQSGLSKSLTKLGLRFSGTKHNALDDAKNTFYAATKLLTKMINVA